MTKKNKTIKEFEQMIGMAELKVLSEASLKRPLTDKEYQKMMKLKESVLGGS